MVNRVIQLGFMTLFILFFSINSFCTAEPNQTEKIQQLHSLIAETNELELQIGKMTSNFQLLKNKTQKLKQDTEEKEIRVNQLRSNYLKVKQDDKVNKEDKTKAYQEFRTANILFLQSSEELSNTEQELRAMGTELKASNIRRQQLEESIVRLKADIFNIYINEPFWIEGYAEKVIDTAKVPSDIKQQLLEAAKKDAIEKGIQSLQNRLVSMPELALSKDTLSQVKVKIVQEDNADKYGQVIEGKAGNITKYTTVVHYMLTVDNISNPFENYLK